MFVLLDNHSFTGQESSCLLAGSYVSLCVCVYSRKKGREREGVCVQMCMHVYVCLQSVCVCLEQFYGVWCACGADLKLMNSMFVCMWEAFSTAHRLTQETARSVVSGSGLILSDVQCGQVQTWRHWWDLTFDWYVTSRSFLIGLELQLAVLRCVDSYSTDISCLVSAGSAGTSGAGSGQREKVGGAWESWTERGEEKLISTNPVSTVL